jgi:hypothetical protein
MLGQQGWAQVKQLPWAGDPHNSHRVVNAVKIASDICEMQARAVRQKT